MILSRSKNKVAPPANCPFCGAEAIVRTLGARNGVRYRPRRPCRVECSSGCFKWKVLPTYAKAVEAWNNFIPAH